MKEIITIDQLKAITPATDTAKQIANERSIVVAFNEYGERFEIDRLHRLCHVLCQVAHESGSFHYDKEVWGPTPAQKGYDTRKDLGNTTAVDGDGQRNAGRGPIQVTGGHNLRAFSAWAKKHFGAMAPDFFENPDLINTDPWEGLSILWYWDEGNPTGKSLNRYADQNDIEMITRRINGGLNGYGDRLAYYTRCGLVLLGYRLEDFKVDLRVFQTVAKRDGTYDGEIDGIDGPRSRAAIHLALGKKDDVHVTASPVIEKKTETVEVKVPVETKVPVPTVPKAAGQQGRNIFALIGAGLLAIGPGIGNFFLKLDPWMQIGFAVIGAALLVFVYLNLRNIFLQVKSAIDLVGNSDTLLVVGNTKAEEMTKSEAKAEPGAVGSIAK